MNLFDLEMAVRTGIYPEACENSDREIYTTRDERGDFYGDKIFVTSGGGIGFNVSGRCIVRPLREWFAMAASAALFAAPDES